jgi:hypothetical protein
MNCSENKRKEETLSESKQNFTRENIEKETNVRLVDSDDETHLDLFCYNRCDNDEDNFIKQCRGLVFHDKELVVKSYPYADEYNHTEYELLQERLKNFDEWTFYISHEGALLRMFYFSGKWFLSTHRKLNAFRSKWSSRESFGTLFKQALEHEVKNSDSFKTFLGEEEHENILERFQSKLNKNKQYMFLLRNGSDNRIVCQPPKETSPKVYHVGTFTNGEQDSEEDICIVRPYRYKFNNLEDILTYIENDVDPLQHQGVVCFGKNNIQIKILHRDYQDLFRARGNEPSLKFRYLQVRMNRRMTQALYYLYPNMKSVFDNCENSIFDVAKNLYNAYVQRFIKKTYVTVPREEFHVISECHSWYLSDREHNRISLEKIISSLNKQSPTNLNHMIRRFNIEQTNTTVPRTGVPRTGVPVGADGKNLEPLTLKRLLVNKTSNC